MVQLPRRRFSTAAGEAPQTPYLRRTEGAMNSKQVMTVTVLATVLAWSTVMTVLGHLAAVAALLPALGLLIQQIVSACNGGGDARRGVTAGSEELSR
nr:hypothetical protein StreXyl84_79850 [Streptomyces sp. Xyl84]